MISQDGHMSLRTAECHEAEGSVGFDYLGKALDPGDVGFEELGCGGLLLFGVVFVGGGGVSGETGVDLFFGVGGGGDLGFLAG